MVEKKSCFQLVANIIMAVLALCCLFPFLLLVMSSLTDENTLIREGYSIIPKQFGLDSYAYLWKNADQIGLAYGITILVTFVGKIIIKRPQDAHDPVFQFQSQKTVRKSLFVEAVLPGSHDIDQKLTGTDAFTYDQIAQKPPVGLLVIMRIASFRGKIQRKT